MTRDTYDLFAPRPRGRFGDDESAERPPRAPAAAELHAFTLALHGQTFPGRPERGAVKVSDSGEEAAAVWIPKSLCRIEELGRSIKGVKANGQSVQLPTIRLSTQFWLARDKGLL